MVGITDVRRDIYRRLDAAHLDVDVLLDHEPVVLPPGITLTVATAGVTSDAWRIALRVYVPGKLPPRPAQERLDSVLDTALDHLPRYGPDEWQVSWDPDLAAFIAECVLEVPRSFED